MNSVVNKTVSEIIDNEYKAYSIYCVENRAIPSYIDGMKPSARKILYSMLNYYKGKKVKVAELGTSISQFNYHHGETSAMGAAITLTSSWNNNMPVFRGHGNFGSRLIQEAAAPRYIFADLNPDFYKYFSDFEVCNKHSDPDNPEPQQYLPVIPWVLVNGVEGIAVGFACKFLSHSTKDIAKACTLAVKGKLKDDYVLPVTLPDFKGEIIQEEHNKIITRGIVERTKRNTWTITEVPWGYDREKFFNSLDKLLEQNKISDFEDMCDESGFKFVVKMDTSADAKCAENPIDFFKLEKAFTENYTALDEKGNIILFNNKLEIIRRFVQFRIDKVQDRIDYDLTKLSTDILWLKTKYAFVKDVVGKKINLMNFTRSDLLEKCIEKYNVEKDIATRLLSIPVYDMTTDMITELESKIMKLEADQKALQESNAKDVYLGMLKSIS